ncbi:FAD binding domain-containing protein [Mycolicibacterium mengxianglii]|uniref:FAD binding domain-containing protein n=1 Tax=Mycolicibacterium mengxianglii TaxID=2736649 RepID=UPI0018EF1CEA|nr:xanthine dehydrogenase family protein subunit M [Mycolicibacterium mengxianglii]
MKPAPFAYHRPFDLDDVVDLLAEYDGEAKILAGGQSLTPMLALRLAYFDNLIDISRLPELQGIERRGDMLRIGAGTTHAAVGVDAGARAAVPLLSQVTPFIGHFQIRNRGTFGGAVAHADPAGEYPLVALTLDASMEAASKSGTRMIPATDFFAGLWETALAPDEVLTAVEIPLWRGRCGYGFHEFARRHGDFAIAGAAVAVQLADDGRVQRASIGLMGLGSTPLRATAAEQLVTGAPAADLDADEIGRSAMTGLDDVPADLQGSPAYRTRVGAAMVARAWADAIIAADLKETVDA